MPMPFAAWQATRWIDSRLPDTRRSLNRYVIYNGPMRLADDLLHTGRRARFLRSSDICAGEQRPRQSRRQAGEPRLRHAAGACAATAASGTPSLLRYRQPAPRLSRAAQPARSPSRRTSRSWRPTARVSQRDDAIRRHGLSPAIWSGAVSPQSNYVTPFWPMNTLEKLLDANASHPVDERGRVDGAVAPPAIRHRSPGPGASDARLRLV